MPIDLLFPTAIYSDKIHDFKKVNELLLPRIKEIQSTIKSGSEGWMSPVYNTLGTYDILTDPVFTEVVLTLTTHVKHFASKLGVDQNIKRYSCKEGWINIMNKYGFQDFHHHHSHTFSAVYYVKVPKGSSNIVFENPMEPDMKPVAATVANHMNVMTRDFTAEEGKFLIFRSHLRHCVPQHMIDDDRICLAFNFD